MDDKPLLPGTWIDNLNWDAVHSEADVREVFRMVEEKKAELRAAAIERASLN